MISAHANFGDWIRQWKRGWIKGEEQGGELGSRRPGTFFFYFKHWLHCKTGARLRIGLYILAPYAPGHPLRVFVMHSALPTCPQPLPVRSLQLVEVRPCAEEEEED